VERSHQTDDNEFYIPQLGLCESVEEFLWREKFLALQPKYIAKKFFFMNIQSDVKFKQNSSDSTNLSCAKIVEKRIF